MPAADPTHNAAENVFKVALTGGIGSGKSAAADFFAEYGTTIVDTDRLARELVEPGEPALAAIRAAFGDHVMHADGHLDRAALRQLVFANPDKKQQLEDILHPPIRALAAARLAQAGSPYAIVVIPLLVETGQTGNYDRVLVIDAPETLQRKRVAERDGLADNVLNDILASQATRAARLAAADDVIVNDRDLDNLRERVRELHAHYTELAHANRSG